MESVKTSREFSGKEGAMKTTARVMIVLGLFLVPLVVDAGEPPLRPSHRVGIGDHGRAALNRLPAEMLAKLSSRYSLTELEETPTVVGDEYCLACHGGPPTRESKHRQALRKPMAESCRHL